jgi:class 3 adenylate cyclase
MLRNIRGTRTDSSTAITAAGRRRKSLISNKISIPTTFDDTLKAISSFVPSILLKNLLEERSAMRPHSSSMNGICLMADISGFTRLSGVFCSQGKDGLDGLQSATSGYMGSLVNAIYIYGGDVIKFAGDALVCIFGPTDESEEEFLKCCASALQCAWVLKDICTAELTLHVGISCGCICFGRLGGFENKWECLISGECISQISKCLDVAPSKHVAITAEFYQHLLKQTSLELVTCEIAETTSDTYLVNTVTALSSVENIITTSNNATDDPLFISQTACYVPRPVTQALMAGAFNFLAELREVTTVFIKMDGYDCAAHKDLLSLQKYFYACQEILSDSGGFMRQFLVDDKGCVLIALWGVPTATYHDDCSRALGASVRIRSKLVDMKMPCSFGITTGIVYCGNVGNEVRREYAAVGDVVNLAARLMSKAHGEILMDESTYHRLPEEVHRKLRKQPPMAVKGKDKPITSYQFDSTNTVQEDGRLGASLVDCALGEELPIRQICRDAFTGPLNTLLSDSPAKEINFLILEGRTGTGREASIRWLRRRCNAKRLRMVSVRLKKADSSIDYRGLAKIFRHIIGEENFDDSERQTFVVNQLLRQMYPRDAETRDRVAYPTMRHTLAVSCPLNPAQRRKQSPKPNAADGSNGSNSNEHKKDFYFCSRKSSRCDVMFNADKPVATVPAFLMLTNLKDIFSHLLAEQPTVLIVEDAHEMDELSWKVLSSLLKMQIKAFIVLTQEPIAYLRNLFLSVGTQTRLGELINPESILSYDWIESYVNLITEKKKSSYITLSEYSLKEVRTQIASTLKVPVKDLPKGLDHMAFNLSGGNPFWVDEISSFLVTYGVPEFISVLETKKEASSTNRVSNSSNHHVSEPRTNIKNQGPDTLLKVIKPGVPRIVRGSSSKLFSMFGTMKSGSKLEFLVVCRFAKLSVDEQSTARTASIIGTSFTADVLLNALPLQLGAYMPTILQSLVELHWLQSKSEVNAAGAIRVEYSFSHPLMHQTLYDLTPSSVKRAIHLSIAQVMEVSN